MVKSKLSKPPIILSKKARNTNQNENSTKQSKISTYFKKSTQSSSASKIAISSYSHSSKDILNVAKNSNGAKLCSPIKIDDDDSDLEIIESTPQSVLKKSFITKLSNVHSPEIIPSTPGCISLMKSPSTKLHSLFESSLKLRKSHLSQEASPSFAFGKSVAKNLSSCSKRAAEMGTGISPLSKKNIERTIQNTGICKMNILNKINSDSSKGNTKDELDFELLQDSLSEIDVHKKIDFEHSNNASSFISSKTMLPSENPVCTEKISSNNTIHLALPPNVSPFENIPDYEEKTLPLVKKNTKDKIIVRNFPTNLLQWENISYSKQIEKDASKIKQTQNDFFKSKQIEDISNSTQIKKHAFKNKQIEDFAFKNKQKEEFAFKNKQIVENAFNNKQAGEDAPNTMQTEEDVSKSKQTAGDISKSKQSENDFFKSKQIEDISNSTQIKKHAFKNKQIEDIAFENKQKEELAFKNKQIAENAFNNKQAGEDAPNTMQTEEDVSKSKQTAGDISKSKQSENDFFKSKQIEDICKNKQTEEDAPNTMQTEEVSKSKQTEEDDLADLLSINFDCISPFKESYKEAPKSKENHRVKQLLQEGIGSLSFASKGNFGRYIVTSIENDVYQRELLLHLISPMNNISKICSLTGFWYESVVKEGDVVHILFAEEINNKYTISNDEGLIIINPDFLISGTSIVSGVFCRRKAVLNEFFKGYDSGNVIMIIGSLVHQLFQEVVKCKSPSLKEIQALMETLMLQPVMLKEFYAMSLTEEKVREEVIKFCPLIQSWADTYLDKGGLKEGMALHNNWVGKVTSIEDIEENIWSPRFGLKGKIDLTVETKVRGQTKVVPLELKTGRSSFSAEHKGQVALYTMMMSDRRLDPKAGLLLYLRNGSMSEVPAGVQEKRGLIQLRNQLVQFLSQALICNTSGEHSLPVLPEPLNSQRSCNRCSHLINCTALQRVQENIPQAPHDMASLVPMMTEHLSTNHLEYFRKWCLMLHLEVNASANDSAIRALWCQNPSSRESSGVCISNLVVEDSEAMGNGYFIHKFHRKTSSEISPSLPHNFQFGENVIVSSENELALSMGVVYTSGKDFLHLILDRNLKLHQDRRNGTSYQADRYEYQNKMSIFFTNLSILLSKTDRSQRIRELIIDGNPPTFTKGLEHTAVSQIRTVLTHLNKEQQRAVLQSLLAEDYSILKGFPGTGKTSTIVGLVRVLSALGHSVLLTSYTHSAVDNILLKLKKFEDVIFMRLGKVSRIHKEILQYSDTELTKDFKSVDQFKEFYNKTTVIATTCLGMSHVIFRKKVFDFCIMDEASQVLEAAALGPLFFCSRFILVGDYLQLPPVIKSHSARSMGMAVSLFERLDSPAASVCLTLQYRMNEAVMRFANHLMYEGQLKCALEDLKTACLDQMASPLEDGPFWLRKVTSPCLEDSVLFVDTSNGAPETKDCGNHLINPVQAEITLSLLRAFEQMGVPMGEIGVITPYRAQVKLLRDKISRITPSPQTQGTGETIEVNTVDQYQGRDKSVIVYSCVRSGVQPEEILKGEILNDSRRLNVAITRAKFKLIIIGDLSTLCHFEPFEILLSHATPSQIYELKDGVDEFRWNEFASNSI